MASKTARTTPRVREPILVMSRKEGMMMTTLETLTMASRRPTHLMLSRPFLLPLPYLLQFPLFRHWIPML